MSITQTIWKFPLNIVDKQSKEMPLSAEILTVQVQNGTPCIWALVNPEASTEIRTFEMFGTGHPVLSDIGVSRKYLSTFQRYEGSLVFHVFEYTGV